MNLHEQLDVLIAEQKRTNELLAQLAGGAVKAADAGADKAPAKTSAKTSSKAAAKEEKPAITIEQAYDAAMALKDTHGTAVVKAILVECKVPKLAEMTEAQAPAVYKACVEKKDELDRVAQEALEDDI